MVDPKREFEFPTGCSECRLPYVDGRPTCACLYVWRVRGGLLLALMAGQFLALLSYALYVLWSRS